MSKRVLIIGCGYLGLPTAKLWLANGHRVTAMSRNADSERGAMLRGQGIDVFQGDVLDDPVTALPEADIVLYAVGMDRSSGRSFAEVYRDGLANVLERIARWSKPPERFVYISSTSVYGQKNGEIVDEESPTEPLEANGKIILEAERLVQARLPNATILRFAGIYGPGRVLRRKAVEAGEAYRGDADHWLNLIHVEDGARAVVAVVDLAEPGSTFCVSDGEAVRRRDFYGEMAELLHAPPPRFEPSAAEGGNRRVSSRKLVDKLGFAFRHPSYREGLRNAIG